MTFASLAEQMRRKFPELAEGTRQLERFDQAVAQLPVEPFYEPFSLIEKDQRGRGKHVNIDPSMLNARAKHMAYSMRIRMHSFEPVILRELISGTTLGSSTALRAHLEAAAMATLCLLRLNEARTDEGLEKLASLMPQTLFGTALFNKRTKNERVLEMLSFAEQQTITVCTAIRALDEFTYGDSANGSTEILYALLCESAHPNHRGTRTFVHSHEVAPEGWRVEYSASEHAELPIVSGLVDGLRLSMRGGYAASEMLRVASFINEELPYRGTPIEEGKRIWSTFLAPDA